MLRRNHLGDTLRSLPGRIKRRLARYAVRLLVDAESSGPVTVSDGDGVSEHPTGVIDQYVTAVPSVQNALDIFRGEWASQLPGAYAEVHAGSARLFEDDRITWAAAQLGPFEGREILELGPLEGGHTWMLEQLGAQSIVAIEANTRAYLKCLIVKEILGIQRAQFLCGDFIEYLRSNERRYDVCIASGVLYHMTDPVELLALLARATDRLFLWTHYYDDEVIARNTEVAQKFSAVRVREADGRQYTLHQYAYRDARNWNSFCGGSGQHSFWMQREDILMCLQRHGLDDIRIGFDHPDHPNGPSFAVAAMRHNCEG